MILAVLGSILPACGLVLGSFWFLRATHLRLDCTRATVGLPPCGYVTRCGYHGSTTVLRTRRLPFTFRSLRSSHARFIPHLHTRFAPHTAYLPRAVYAHTTVHAFATPCAFAVLAAFPRFTVLPVCYHGSYAHHVLLDCGSFTVWFVHACAYTFCGSAGLLLPRFYAFYVYATYATLRATALHTTTYLYLLPFTRLRVWLRFVMRFTLHAHFYPHCRTTMPFCVLGSRSAVCSRRLRFCLHIAFGLPLWFCLHTVWITCRTVLTTHCAPHCLCRFFYLVDSPHTRGSRTVLRLRCCGLPLRAFCYAPLRTVYGCYARSFAVPPCTFTVARSRFHGLPTWLVLYTIPQLPRYLRFIPGYTLIALRLRLPLPNAVPHVAAVWLPTSSLLPVTFLVVHHVHTPAGFTCRSLPRTRSAVTHCLVRGCHAVRTYVPVLVLPVTFVTTAVRLRSAVAVTTHHTRTRAVHAVLRLPFTRHRIRGYTTRLYLLFTTRLRYCRFYRYRFCLFPRFIPRFCMPVRYAVLRLRTPLHVLPTHGYARFVVAVPFGC